MEAEQKDKKIKEPDWDVVKLWALIIALVVIFIIFGAKVFFWNGNIDPPNKSAIHKSAKPAK
ncbi:MAG: hypothetical protein UV75_C0007G0036 [Candidatus Giovannonibacteria bacterium GW2011_GWA1_43_15]|uniref:Uncharacterized protein n=1 Tax=Candidatus Giovannonibacteria bacterium RIFCSPLOWO2_12_FULL_43_26 TaxID=1798363 RepID=A0A1F5XV40_9BACT|nr:MAG: hypothetical protein UV75_C0007G0036 [Candidatus Giovannonibacteria bacterium GW2011_GWA1_43_15]OGF58096.1 MAG: hypothetical protein A2652_03265 [Candidatus Giovannonibacteria bacterium RIFCSPHIGHO2_01_FULL_43_140]OGF70312.1 MAG: hypothetical protein A3C76_01560 [Candidatus Giovannonibacteria bacterium RIFCSPHIGHO2_02_FULL_44_51]OGF86469.1 MAG: hypothetical protein A3I28_03325 [Candidatus Giovannonibacteria bacterium RIFCSPLOWO2_02_FULL_43_37]OGF91767.1 MAG: hypothetical protein A3H05_0